jgi:hypothetical protein
MTKETWLPLVIVVAIVIALFAGWSYLGAQREAEREAEHRARIAQREAREAHATEEARTESAELLHEVLPGIALGTDLDAVRHARPADAVSRSTSHTDPGFDLYEEQLPNGAQVMYGFSARTHLLERIQMLSMLPDVDSLVPHLTAMQSAYGAPTGIWDCTDEAGISTRRFTWRGSHTGLADIALIYGTRVSLTLYVTSNEQMARSLQRAGCQPTPPGEVGNLRTSAPEQIERIQREQEAQP